MIKKIFLLCAAAFLALHMSAAEKWVVLPPSLADSVFKHDWATYLGCDSLNDAAEQLKTENPAALTASSNPIIKKAIATGDAATMRYLKQLITYFNVANRLKSGEPLSQADSAACKRTLTAIKGVATAATDSAYLSRYHLLLMHCNLILGAHKANQNYWKANAFRFPKNSVYRRLALAIYIEADFANIRNNPDKRNKSVEILTEQGNVEALEHVLADRRNLEGIQEEYAASPNSVALPFLVQDYVNHAPAERAERLRFVQFAGNVVKEDKTEQPEMWTEAAKLLTPKAKKKVKRRRRK